jgi:hypothetical protein
MIDLKRQLEEEEEINAVGINEKTKKFKRFLKYFSSIYCFYYRDSFYLFNQNAYYR